MCFDRSLVDFTMSSNRFSICKPVCKLETERVVFG